MTDQHGAEIAEAVRAAEAWLELVDAGKYGEAWDTAASLMRGAVTKEGLEKALEGARGPLGAVVQRSVSSTTFATELPGAPDGEYVVVTLETRFDNKAHAVETVTPKKEADGSFHVSGYFIK